jgi:hypothetical protein
VKKFVKILSGPRLIGLRVYAKGSVVEVDEVDAALFIKEKAACSDPGPASEPAATLDPPVDPPVDPTKKPFKKADA